MNHGRLMAGGVIFAGVLLLLQGACRGEEVAVPLRFTWEQPNHAAGIYHVKAEATLTVVVDNVSQQPADLAGEILFGSRPEGGDNGGKDELKVLSVTPIAPATIAPRQRVKIPLALTFAGAGTYALRWKPAGGGDIPEASIAVDSAAGSTLQCIFAPRSAKPAEAASAPAGEETPWVTMLPPAAVRTAGYLADYAQQTAVCRFVIDERFSYDPATNVGLGFGASTGVGAKELDAFFAEAAKADGGRAGSVRPRIVLRLTVPVAAADAKSVSALKEYVTDAVRRAKGTLAAVAVVPEWPAGSRAEQAPTDALRHNFRTLYLAAYEAAKGADRNVSFLGAGSASLTGQWLAQDPKLLAYIDALAITDAVPEPVLGRQLLAGRTAPGKVALHVLPPLGGGGSSWAPAAAALSEGAVVVAVPPPEVDHGVTAHLLGGTVLWQRVRISVPAADAPRTSAIPYIAVFQGDGYAVAAIAGFSAGTDLDAAYPALARTRTQVESADRNAADPAAGAAPAYPHLLVSDDTHSMRVVDGAGAAVDCRVGDHVFVPAGNAVVYLLQGGGAEDLAGSLRPATAQYLPLFEPVLSQKADGALTLRLRNCGVREVGGTVRVLQPPANGADAAVVVAEKAFPAISPEKILELPMPVTARPRAGAPVVIEITTTGSKPMIQRTAVVVEYLQR